MESFLRNMPEDILEESVPSGTPAVDSEYWDEMEARIRANETRGMREQVRFLATVYRARSAFSRSAAVSGTITPIIGKKL